MVYSQETDLIGQSCTTLVVNILTILCKSIFICCINFQYGHIYTKINSKWFK